MNLKQKSILFLNPTLSFYILNIYYFVIQFIIKLKSRLETNDKNEFVAPLFLEYYSVSLLFII